MTVDLLGTELSPSEQRVLAVYEELKALCAEDLPPNAHAGVRASLALMHNVVIWPRARVRAPDRPRRVVVA